MALPHRTLTPNLALRGVIEELKQQMPASQRQQLEAERAKVDVAAILDVVAESQTEWLEKFGRQHRCWTDGARHQLAVHFCHIAEISDTSINVSVFVKVLSTWDDGIMEARTFQLDSTQRPVRTSGACVSILVGDDTGRVMLCLVGEAQPWPSV